jgi:hypothetical protein
MGQCADAQTSRASVTTLRSGNGADRAASNWRGNTLVLHGKCATDEILQEGVPLQIKVLILRRNKGITDQHGLSRARQRFNEKNSSAPTAYLVGLNSMTSYVADDFLTQAADFFLLQGKELDAFPRA